MKKIHPFHLFSEESRSEMINFFSSFAEGMSMAAAEVEEMSGWLIRGVEIFKAGIYRGIPYSEQDLADMAANFKILKEKELFDPVFKKNHSENVEDQIGWIVNVYSEGELLFADIHLTDWMAYDKIKSKTWRYLSSEIYPPALAAEEFDDVSGYVLRGVAIVSVPKVKGLKGIILNGEILENNEEGNIMDKAKLIAMLAKLGITFSEEEQEKLTVEDLESRLTQKFTELQQPAGQQQQQQNFGEGTVVMSAAEVIALSQKISGLEGQVETFSETVRGLQKDSKKIGIEKKVDALVKQGKVLPAEKAEIMAFAEDLSDQQSEKYFAALEKRPAVVEFGEGGGQQTHDDDADVDAALDQIRKVKTYE